MNEKIQDFFLNCEECVLENPRNFYGVFTLGPFKNSQSLTVANALRRTLLSELRGIAITHLEIDGAVHEYSTLVGVRESILDILLNFKHIVLKNTSPLKKPLFGYLNVRGPGIVRAADLKLPPIIQCVDPDQYIATLSENGKLVLKFTISDFQNFTQTKEISENFHIPEYREREHFNFEMFKNRVKASSFKKEKNKITNLEHIYSKRTNYLLEQKNSSGQKLTGASASIHTFSDLGAKLSRENKPNFFSRGNQLVNMTRSFGLGAKLQNKEQVIKEQQNTSAETISLKKNFKSLPSQVLTKEIRPTTNSLWVDPLFNPISKVSYLIETIGPGQTHNLNQQIRIELWTNGSIHPRKAFYDALTYLKTMFDKLEYMKYLNYKFTNTLLESEKTITKIFKTFEYDFHFYNSLEEQKKILTSLPSSSSPSPQGMGMGMKTAENHFIPKEIQQIEKNYSIELLNFSYKNILEIPIEKFSFPSRLKKALTKNNFSIIGDIVKYTPSELKKFRGIGNVSISLIQKHFAKVGLKLESKNK